MRAKIVRLACDHHMPTRIATELKPALVRNAACVERVAGGATGARRVGPPSEGIRAEMRPATVEPPVGMGLPLQQDMRACCPRLAVAVVAEDRRGR
jgi:hypothetical protein